MKVFCSEEILLQHSVLSYRIDLYFPRHKLAIEGDGKGHKDINKCKEIKREKAAKEHLGFNFFGLILMKKILMCMLKLVKYTVTLINHLQNL